MRTLYRGSHGHDVEFMQCLLVRADTREHADLPYSGSDGRFDGECERAVRAFQRRHPGLVVDGVVGPQTWTALGLRHQREHPIRLFGQPDGMSCWSAAATMILGNTMSVGRGRASLGLRGGIIADLDNLDTFARGLGWRMPNRSLGVQELVGLLLRMPLWIGTIYRDGANHLGGHAVVLSGVYSDGDPSGQGTMVRIHDPWPPGRGTVYGSFVNPIILRDGARRAAASLEYVLIPS
ncbi:peptidoglycan-binding protein [Thermomonas flagellata]|uniref:peptidoglycan-binding protein n=1 Tax=Thermomonas flagellata TaxID=2888524 RepID=UPI001F03FBC7|nr:peptidoglycan-binding protein [Thermomonas flagellata]